ncbi:hypothetical protein ARMA_2432 [Ardenticatena maritima]|uniref:Uncharacterized protein n=1 Tax=Ardenticatena maritima TaxID=872965 RepID=A0A0M8KAW9_9CHLR|nr:hypothetical protein ARMA_2432 [Ardenticatena maritima]
MFAPSPSLKSPNPRKGIETDFTPSAFRRTSLSLKSPNPRKGIETQDTFCR